jgi:hypothetical protein
VTAGFFFDLPFMKKAKRDSRIDSLSGGKNYVKEWSSGPQRCPQHFNVSQFTSMEPIAKHNFPHASPHSFTGRKSDG